MSFILGFIVGFVVAYVLLYFAIRKFGLVMAHKSALKKDAVKATKKDLGL